MLFPKKFLFGPEGHFGLESNTSQNSGPGLRIFKKFFTMRGAFST